MTTKQTNFDSYAHHACISPPHTFASSPSKPFCHKKQSLKIVPHSHQPAADTVYNNNKTQNNTATMSDDEAPQRRVRRKIGGMSGE
jgi:hypothetical protein